MDEELPKYVYINKTGKPLKEHDKDIIEGYSVENRDKMTPAEKAFQIILFQVRKYLIKSNKIDLGKIYPQFVILSNSTKHAYILDFYVPRLRAAFEIDGGYHDKRKDYDKRREEYCRSKGIKTIRYRNEEVLKPNARDTIRKDILAYINKYRHNSIDLVYYPPVEYEKKIDFLRNSYRKERQLRRSL
jgi:very-short-patch-repair endonuclease